MEGLRLQEAELDNVIDISQYINLPESQFVGDIAVGCKGCEGGCAAEICATDRG